MDPSPPSLDPDSYRLLVEHAKVFLLQCGVREETLADLDDEDILANMHRLHAELFSGIRGSVTLFRNARWMLFFTPFRWRWERITMYGWALTHWGPFLLFTVEA